MFFNRPKPKFKMLEEPQRGIVDEAIGPNEPGRVKAMATYWPAELYEPNCQTPLLPGESVLVLAINNITLLVVKL